MSTNTNNNVLQPFYQSRQVRHAYLNRTRTLLSALDTQDVTLLTLPNNNTNVDERRPTSTYIIRPLSTNERTTLLDPKSCNCHITNDKNTNIQVMYRVAGNGEGSSMSSWDVSSSLKRQVRNNTFDGNIILGILLDGPDTTATSSSSSSTKLSNLVGITNNGLIHQTCILEPGCSVHKNTEVSNTHVMKYAAIIGCGTISYSLQNVEKSKQEYNFDLINASMDIEVGPEAGGGRVINVSVENTLVDVTHGLNMDSNGGTIAPLLLDAATSLSKSSTTNEEYDVTMNVLCPHSSIIHTPQTHHVHLLPHSTIDCATSVSSAVLLPNASIKSGSTVSHALLQWSSTITSQSDAHHVFLMECACVGPHSFTANTIYGPDSHVSGGEVHCTIFGPNANSHHQSLLIGILWPLGRGNVGYGSNVGSNHTGRIPDQETSVGEGTFWGLGCVIKFPVDMTCAPYTIVAAGVQLPPQRITLPFSLITDGPGGMNQLTPGWLLQYSPYTIARSEVKFANRRTAKRHDFYTGWKILRPGIMDLLVDARDLLLRANDGQQQKQQQAAGDDARTNKKMKKVYKTDREIQGLGANQLTEKGRQIGIVAYTDAIQRYVLRGLLHRLVTLANNNNASHTNNNKKKGGLMLNEVLQHVGLDGIRGGTADSLLSQTNSAIALLPPSKPIVNWPVLPWNEESHADAELLWKHQHWLLMKELPLILGGDNDVNNNNILSTLLEKCIALEDDHAKRVYKSKARDDVRGASTVPGYKDVHIPAEKDSVVLASKKEAEDVRNDVQLVKVALGGSGSTVRSRL